MASATSTIPPGSEACWIIGIIFSLSRSEEHTSELQSQSNLVCRLLLEKKKKDVEILVRLDCLCQIRRSAVFVKRICDCQLGLGKILAVRIGVDKRLQAQPYDFMPRVLE